MRKFLILAGVLPALAFAACGSGQTLEQICSGHGGIAPFPTPNDEEAYCKDGTEVENEGSGWQEDTN